MRELTGRVVAITGAASGIGQALAVECARSGAHVALADVDDSGLADTVTRCEGHGVKVSSSALDVSDRPAMFAWANDVVDRHEVVHMIVNNAGVALGATAASASFEDVEWLMSINFWGVVHGTQAFLPHLEASGSGHVVNISSVFGLLGIPTQSAYNASKFAVRGYTDALRMELEIAGSSVSATTVHPGGIRTNIARNARVDASIVEVGSDEDFVTQFDRLARTTPQKAACQILRAVKRNRRRALIGPDAVLFDAASRLPAAVTQRLLIAGARRQQHT